MQVWLDVVAEHGFIEEFQCGSTFEELGNSRRVEHVEYTVYIYTHRPLF